MRLSVLFLRLIVLLAASSPSLPSTAEVLASQAMSPQAEAERERAFSRWCGQQFGPGPATSEPPVETGSVDRASLAQRAGVPLETRIARDTSERQLGFAGWWQWSAGGRDGRDGFLVVEQLSADRLDIVLFGWDAGRLQSRRHSLHWGGDAFRSVNEWTDGYSELRLAISPNNLVVAFFSGSFQRVEGQGYVGDGIGLCFLRVRD